MRKVVPLAAAVLTVALTVTLGGCAKQYGVTDSKIGEGKALAHEVVDDVYEKLPPELVLQGPGEDDERDTTLPCGLSEDPGGAEDANGSTQWSHGFYVLFTRQVSNDELEKMLQPDGAQWKHTKTEIGATDDDRWVVYDSENVRFTLDLAGMDEERPGMTISASTACYNNGVSGISE